MNEVAIAKKQIRQQQESGLNIREWCKTHQISEPSFYYRLRCIRKDMQSQYKLNEELEKKYAEFIKDLEEQLSQFYVLIENAFMPNFRESFLHPITLAQASGVEEDEIPTSIDDIDAFFMD